MKILVGLLTLAAIFGSFYGVGRIAIFIMDIGAKPGNKWEDISTDDRPSVMLVGFIVIMMLVLVIGFMQLVGTIVMNSIG